MEKNISMGEGSTNIYGMEAGNKGYFSWVSCCDTMGVPENMPDIGQVMSMIVDPEIISIRIINTAKGISAEGNCLSGKKAAVELKLKQKILYAADIPGQSIHIMETEVSKIVYIVIPSLIEGTDPEFLLKYKYLRVGFDVQDVSANKIDARTVFKCFYIFLSLHPISISGLCYASYDEQGQSSIFVCGQDGSNDTKVTLNSRCKNLKPKWSPDGRGIAFLSNCEGRLMLYHVNPRNLIASRITSPDIFTSISSFCWAKDGLSIIFTSSIECNKELFIVSLVDLKWRQLTHGSPSTNSYKPKCSPDGKRIAYLKSISGITYLYVMDMEGLNCIKVSKFPGIKDFCWSHDSRHIAFILAAGGRPDEICVWDVSTFETVTLGGCEGIIEKRIIKYAPLGNLLAFIGSDFITEDVFIYDLHQERASNITSNAGNTQVGDFTWNADSTRIFFSSNKMYYFNIYSISINDGSERQISNTTASSIELDYRPRIG